MQEKFTKRFAKRFANDRIGCYFGSEVASVRRLKRVLAVAITDPNTGKLAAAKASKSTGQ
jgi:hypothetical protein